MPVRVGDGYPWLPADAWVLPSDARTELAGYVLQEIAGQDGDGGTEAAAVSRLVAGRRSVEPDDEEVHGALALLEARGLVVRLADRYILSALMRLRAPKTSDGMIGMSRQAWIRLCGSLDLTG